MTESMFELFAECDENITDFSLVSNAKKQTFSITFVHDNDQDKVEAQQSRYDLSRIKKLEYQHKLEQNRDRIIKEINMGYLCLESVD